MKASVTLQDIALVQMQGGTVGATVEYPGFSNRRNGERAAQRDLRALATPLLSCTVYCGQEAANLDIGDTFKLEWPEYHDGAIIMRVTGMAFGDGRTDRIRIDCVQDVFGTPQEALLSDDRGSLWTNPSAPPTNITDGEISSDLEVAGTGQLAVEAPYWQMVDFLGQDEIDSRLNADAGSGFLLTSGRLPDGFNALEALIHVDAGTGYVQQGTADFSPYARLAESIGYMETSVEITEAQELSRVEVGTFAQIDQELVRVDNIDGNTITVGRGILDTVPQPHASGTSVLFWQDFAGSDDEEYTAAEEINVKLQPRNNSGTASLAAATAMPVTFDSRAIRPYPPGNVRVNGEPYEGSFLPEDTLTITWAHRNRLTQTGVPFADTTEGDIGPEAGTTYTLQILDDTETVIVDETGISGTEWVESSDELSEGEYTVRLWSVRDGYASWQAHVFTIIKTVPSSSGP
jgi:hypothetical protein